MIISASRRTDIPACYMDWFLNRLREKFVLVRNPMNAHQLSRVSLSPDVVDGIVFWTKNPLPLLEHMQELERYPYYIQFTLTAYDRDVEPGLPSKNRVLIPAFQELARRLGKERVVWRYDPIFLSDRYTMDYHCRCFQILARRLGRYTERCIVSFLDLYRNTERQLRPLGMRLLNAAEQWRLLQDFSEIAKAQGFSLNICSEAGDFAPLGVGPSHCVDKALLERIGGCELRLGKDSGQRPACGCFASIDIGTYQTCRNGCLYCYANESESRVMRTLRTYDPASPLLCGTVGPQDVVRERKAVSCRENQLRLFWN